MTPVAVRNNRLIVQARALRNNPDETKLAEWFVQYHELANAQELEGKQGEIIDGLALELTSVQLAQQMKKQATSQTNPTL